MFNIKARQKIPEWLTADLLSIHVIELDIDWNHWSRTLVSLHKFCSMLIEQLIDPRNLSILNLKISTDLPRSSYGWLVGDTH